MLTEFVIQLLHSKKIKKEELFFEQTNTILYSLSLNVLAG